MKNLKNKLTIVFYALILSWVFLPFSLVKAADPNCDFYKQFEIDKTSNAVDGLPQYCTASQLGGTVITVILSLAGSALVLFVIIGGFLLITAGGNEEQSEKGKKVMTNAVLGMVVVVMAFAIVKIVTNALTGNLGSGTTNNGGGGPTVNPGDSNNPGNTDKTAIDAAILRLASKIDIPASVQAGSNIQIVLVYNRQSDAADIKKICGDAQDIGNNVSVNSINQSGKTLGQSVKFSSNPNSYATTLNIPSTQLASGDTVIVQICNVAITAKSITVTQ